MDFVQVVTAFSPAGYEQALLDPPEIQTVGSTGLKALYTASRGASLLDITLAVDVVGSSFEDTYVSVHMEVANRADAADLVGLRLLLDFSLAANDGPSFQPMQRDGSPYATGKHMAHTLPFSPFLPSPPF